MPWGDVRIAPRSSSRARGHDAGGPVGCQSIGAKLSFSERAETTRSFSSFRSNTSSRSDGPLDGRPSQRCESCSIVRARGARDRSRLAAIECRDRAAPSPGQSMARPRTRRRTPPRTATRPPGPPAACECCGRRWRSRCREGVACARCAHRLRRFVPRRRPLRPSRWFSLLAMRTHRALSSLVPPRRATRRAGMLHPERKMFRAASGVRSGLPEVTINPYGHNVPAAPRHRAPPSRREVPRRSSTGYTDRRGGPRC